MTSVVASDDDAGENAEIIYSLHSDDTISLSMFEVDDVTGLVTTSLPLDREASRQHHLVVIATDKSPRQPRNASVQLVVNGWLLSVCIF